MSTVQNPGQRSSFAALRRFVRERAPAERCELCGAALPAEHQHLVEPDTRRLVCSCEACAILFSETNLRYRRVPRRARALPGFQIADSQWDSLLIPIGLAYFFYSTPAARVVAFYPSPAGATESLPEPSTWEELARDNPALAALEPDVEALLVNRLGGARAYYIAPIDECYKLVGLIRTNWRGLSGGSEVWQEIGQFFEDLERRTNA